MITRDYRYLSNLLINRATTPLPSFLFTLVIQLTLREIFAGNYHVIQVPGERNAARRTARNPRL